VYLITYRYCLRKCFLRMWKLSFTNISDDICDLENQCCQRMSSKPCTIRCLLRLWHVLIFFLRYGQKDPVLNITYEERKLILWFVSCRGAVHIFFFTRHTCLTLRKNQIYGKHLVVSIHFIDHRSSHLQTQLPVYYVTSYMYMFESWPTIIRNV